MLKMNRNLIQIFNKIYSTKLASQLSDIIIINFFYHHFTRPLSYQLLQCSNQLSVTKLIKISQNSSHQWNEKIKNDI